MMTVSGDMGKPLFTTRSANVRKSKGFMPLFPLVGIQAFNVVVNHPTDHRRRRRTPDLDKPLGSAFAVPLCSKSHAIIPSFVAKTGLIGEPSDTVSHTCQPSPTGGSEGRHASIRALTSSVSSSPVPLQRSHSWDTPSRWQRASMQMWALNESCPIERMFHASTSATVGVYVPPRVKSHKR